MSSQHNPSQVSAKVTVGSTNVYADLSYSDPESMQHKSSLASYIASRIKANGLSIKDAAARLSIDQESLSKIIRGQFRECNEARLMAMVSHLRARGD